MAAASHRPRIVVLDGHTLNPGDLDWAPLRAIGECILHDRTPREQVVERAAGAEIVLTNNDWATQAEGAPDVTSTAQTVGAFALDPTSADSALVTTLEPGPYTVRVSGADGGTGVAIVELYETSNALQIAERISLNGTLPAENYGYHEVIG